MRNISFAMTTAQIRARFKTVTRRWGWENLKAGTHLMAVEKGMGLKKGETIVRLVEIVVLDVRRERLDKMARDAEYGSMEMRLEGYPFGLHDPKAFVEKLAKEGGKKPSDMITRIEFDYVEAA